MQQILKLLFLTVSLLLAGGTWNDAYPQGHDVNPPRPTKPTTPVKPPRPNKPNRPTKPVKPNRPSKSRQQILDEIVENMVFVEGGTFTMGATSEQGSDADSDEKPAHSVTLSDYYIGKYEVTQAQWKAVMGNNPSYFKGDNLPVEEVSWNDCQTFVTKLNQLTGRKFRLPTEAEWEYAARGGNKSKGYKYSGSNIIDDVAWYDGNSDDKTHPVASKQANELGLYDMSGNVWEWCQDWYGSYSSSAQTNPTGSTSGSDRVLRGGSWSRGATGCRVSNRYSRSLTYWNSIGFRLALSANTGPAALQSNQSSNVASSQMNNSTSMNPQSFTVNGVTFEMVKVEGGTFTMGATSEQGSDAYDDESPTHSVTLSDYYIGKYEVTQAQWKAVMGKSLTQIVSESGWSTYGVGDNYPMYDISYNDCQEFINKLNKLTGKKFRLPTEAEWEYAARGGNKSRGYKYAGSNDIGRVAWYCDNSGSKTHPVGTKQANELGLYDMSGNVWEWCQDWYGDYSSLSQTNPTGPTSGSGRVKRGGSWGYDATYCRVSSRIYFIPTIRVSFIGFRLALSQ